jgi:PleD family two-component response regulator
MPGSFDFIRTEDKPALIAFSMPEWLETAKVVLTELGYKVHAAATHSDFLTRFSQVRYHVVIIEELFAAKKIEENQTLQAIRTMSVNRRRHATIILMGNSFQTFMPMEAFEQGVHAIINGSEISLLKQLIEKVVIDNALFLHSFREVQNRLYATGSNL